MVFFKKRKKGGIDVMLLSFLVLFGVIFILMFYLYRIAIVQGVLSIKDGCDFSNLATYKEIDKVELGESNKIVFNENDMERILKIFKEYLSKNLNLDDNLNPSPSNKVITEPVRVKKMIIYSLENGITKIYTYNDGGIFEKQEKTGVVLTPNGKSVTATSVYTEVQFSIELMFNQTYTDEIKSYTDITN